MTASHDSDNVISLPVGDARRAHNARESEIAELPIGRAQWASETCRHDHSVVDARARTVTCSSCKVALDAIDVLDTIAHEFAEPLRLAQQAQKRFRDLQTDIGRLEREERNAKARVRTARKQALKFDAGAIEVALLEDHANSRYGEKDFHALPEHMQDYARQRTAKSIEAYIGALDDRQDKPEGQ